MAIEYDPAKMPCPPLYDGPLSCPEDLPLNGPGGRTTNVENNEKGILETNVFKVLALHVYDPMGSDHDSYRQGIYGTNSVGDHD